jgi:2-oxoisovalerate dehydrogenase E2 component (dihydrolipoyl transacylase)
MSETKVFHLPDLGEGLPDATIVEWFVKPGDVARLDEPLVSMETAKAVVEVPSPFSGKVIKQHGKAGDVIETGAALVEIEIDAKLPQRAEAEATGHHHGPPKPAKPEPAKPAAAPASSAPAAERSDSGTVVGAMQSSDSVHVELAASVGGVKAVPAVRALAKKLGVDLSRVRPSGADGVVTLKDVKAAAEAGSAKLGAAPAVQAPAAVPAATPQAAARAAEQRTALSASGKPMRTTPPTQSASGQPEQLKGVRRNMARVMAQAHAQVVPTTLSDDADIHAWLPGNDITVRLIRFAGARLPGRARAERLVRWRKPHPHPASACGHRHRRGYRRRPVRAGPAQCRRAGCQWVAPGHQPAA